MTIKKLSQFILKIIFSIGMLFTLIGCLAYEEVAHHVTFPLLYNAFNNFSKEYIVSALATENPYFAQDIPKDQRIPPLTGIAFQLATNIKPGDVRSLLGSELPGFSLYNTHIVVAGEGTNYTNLPIESAPPMEVLLKDRAQPKKDTAEGNKPTAPKTPIPRKKTVLIYHTHSWESFLPLLNGVSKPNEAVSSKVNVSLVGQRVIDDLAQYGIGAMDDKTNMTKLLKSHGLDYYSAYKMSRTVVEGDLKNNPGLRYFFDIHRDSSRGNITTVTINGTKYARIVFVVGKAHSTYEKNLEMAKELNKIMEKDYPGLSRGVLLKDKTMGNGVYNQDLSPHALLFEVGGVDNNKEELYQSADALAKVIDTYYRAHQ